MHLEFSLGEDSLRENDSLTKKIPWNPQGAITGCPTGGV